LCSVVGDHLHNIDAYYVGVLKREVPKGGTEQRNESMGAAGGASGKGCDNCSESQGVK